MTQMIKNLPVMQETPGSIPGLGRSLGEVVYEVVPVVI